MTKQTNFINILTKIKNNIYFIDRFTEKSNFKINQSLAEINAEVKENNILIKKFKEIKNKKSSNQDEINQCNKLAVEMFGRNFSIIDKKISLMETHTQEIYRKINLLAENLTTLCNALADKNADQAEKKDKKNYHEN